MRTLQEMLDLIKSYENDYFDYVMAEMKKAYEDYKTQDDFQDETFADMIDYTFFSMGHDSEDIERIMFNEFFTQKVGKDLIDNIENDFCENNENYKHSLWFANFHFAEVIYPKLNKIVNKNNNGFIVEPLKTNKAKWVVIFHTSFGDIGLDECNSVDEVNKYVRFHQENSNAFEVYELGE